MVFKKPYAFLIKYFRLINLFLVILFSYLCYKLNLIKNIMSDIYRSNLTNYSNLNSTYIGLKMFILIFFIILILGIIILLLKRKKKPLNDYLFSLVYIFVIIVYLIFISNIFFTLSDSIIEQTSLRLYNDISFLIIFPIFYFIIKFIMIVIGFNLKKFNFTQDIIELKQEEQDNEEVEVVFNKNTYKYKRSIRKILREFKYYFLENKFIISIIFGIIVSILFFTFFSMNIFKTNKVNVNEFFVAGGINYKVQEIYETYYDMNFNLIKNNYKYVIVNMNVRANGEAKSIDFKRIRLIYGNDYVYPNNYFNKFFYDLGNPYNNEVLKNDESSNYIFIFEVPKDYKSKKYTLKFYDRTVLEDIEIKGSYKEMKIKSSNLDRNRISKEYKLNENSVFNTKKYGNSNLTLFKYEIKSNYLYKNNDKTTVIRDKDINKNLLILDYKLDLDEKYSLTNYFKNDLEFFDKFVSLTYNYNGNQKTYNNVNALACVDGKVMLSIPYEVKNSNNISVIINFRDVKINFKLK